MNLEEIKKQKGIYLSVEVSIKDLLKNGATITVDEQGNEFVLINKLDTIFLQPLKKYKIIKVASKKPNK